MRLRIRTLPRYVLSEPALIALVWSSVALVALVQGLVVADVNNASFAGSLIKRLAIVPLWAIATPFVLRSARRWPAFQGAPVEVSPLNVAIHVAFGSLFIATANFAIQLPGQLTGTAEPLVQAALRDLAENYPAALVVYLVVVALGHVKATKSEAKRADCLTIRQWNRTHLVRLDDIDWIEAEGNYVVVHASGRSYKGRERISDVAARLDAQRFVRIHRSTIVQASKIREVQPLTHRDHAVILRNGTVLRAARNRRAALSEALSVQL